MRSGDQRPRTYEEYSQQTKKKEMDAELVHKQIANMKKMLQSLEALVNEDIFQMLDNMSLCVTQKENEVQELRTRLEKQEEASEALAKRLKV